MKKIVFSLLFLCIVVVAQSQISIKVGVKGGMNLSKISGSTDFGIGSIENKELTSGHFGLLARVKVLGLIAVQPELLYSMQGSKIEGNIGNTHFSGDLKTNYVQVPVMLKFYPFPMFNLQAGPQLGFLTKAKFDGEDVKDQLNDTMWSVNVGAGLDLPFGLGLDARYCIGVTDVYKENASGSNRNNVITLAASYCF